MTRHAVASVCLIAAVLLACPRAQADDALYEAAKKEGQVVWYTSLIVNQAVRPLVDAFNKKYPGVEVKYARGDLRAECHQGHQRSTRRQGRGRRVRWHRHHGAVAQGRLGRAIHAVGGEQISVSAARSRWPLERLGGLFPHPRRQHAAGRRRRDQDGAGPAQSEMAGQDCLEHRTVVGRAGLCRLRPADHGRRQGHGIPARARQAGHRQCRRHQPRHSRSGDSRASTPLR